MKRLIALYLLTKVFRHFPFSDYICDFIRKQIQNKYHINFSIGEVRAQSFLKFKIENLELHDNLNGFSFSAESCCFSIHRGSGHNFLKFTVSSLRVNGCKINYQKVNSNFSKLSFETINKVALLLKKVNYFTNLFSSIIQYSPEIFILDKLSLRVIDYEFKIASIVKGETNFSIFLSPRANCVEQVITVASGSQGTINFSFMKSAYPLIMNFIALDKPCYIEIFDFDLKFKLSKDVKLEFKLKICDYSVMHENIFSSILTNQSFDLLLNGNLNEEEVILNKCSFVEFNQIKINLNSYYKTSDRFIVSKLSISNLTSKSILNSLPHLRYRKFYESEISGNLSVFFTLSFDTHAIAKHNIKINIINRIISKKKAINLNYLRLPFKHVVIDSPANLEISLDNSNPNFTPLDSISKSLRDTILLTEDPNFYTHKGFDVHYFKYSLISNLNQGKIVRGGSTISMQLIRNLFLGHNRNLFRKLEEFYLTNLMENEFLISKNRIFEIYLNIIEMAPNIFGVSEASRFYFDKHPKDISLQEALVLSYIIPRPIFFLEALEQKSSILLTNLKNHINLFSSLMLRKEEITEVEYLKIDYVIIFTKQLGKLDLSSL